jgi:hypothetical protein
MNINERSETILNIKKREDMNDRDCILKVK